MSDATISPTELKAKPAANQKQMIMLGVLGLVLVVLLFVMVLPALTGGGDSSEPVPVPPAPTADAGGTVTDPAVAPSAPDAETLDPPPERPGRNPFDPPR